MCDLQGIFAAKCALLLSIRVDWWRELTSDKGLFGGNNRRNEQRGSDHETRNALGAPSNVSRIGVVFRRVSRDTELYEQYTSQQLEAPTLQHLGKSKCRSCSRGTLFS